jgi:hypothetical protein
MSLLDPIEKNFELINPYELLENGWEWDDYGKSLRIWIYSTMLSGWPGPASFAPYRNSMPAVMMVILTDINCTHEHVLRTVTSDNPVYYTPPKPKWRLELIDAVQGYRINTQEDTVLTEMIELRLKLNEIVTVIKDEWNIPEQYINNKLLR